MATPLQFAKLPDNSWGLKSARKDLVPGKIVTARNTRGDEQTVKLITPVAVDGPYVLWSFERVVGAY